MPVEQYADQEPAVVVSSRMHRNSGSVAALHRCSADFNCLHIVYVLGLGSLPAQQHADQNGDVIVSRRLHRRNARPVAGLHLCTANAGLRFLPRHPACDWSAHVPRELARVPVQHLPRRGLQFNCRDCGDAPERSERRRKFLELQRDYALLLSRVPWLAELVVKNKTVPSAPPQGVRLFCIHSNSTPVAARLFQLEIHTS
jgi:hypothetical protein